MEVEREIRGNGGPFDPRSAHGRSRDARLAEHCNRLARWRHDAEQARKEYLEGRPAQLRDLYNFWRNLGRFRLLGWRPRPLTNHGESV